MLTPYYNICSLWPSTADPERLREEVGNSVHSTTSEAPPTQGSFQRCLRRCCGSEIHLLRRTASLGRVRMSRSHRKYASRHSNRAGRQQCLVSLPASNCPRTVPRTCI